MSIFNQYYCQTNILPTKNRISSLLVTKITTMKLKFLVIELLKQNGYMQSLEDSK